MNGVRVTAVSDLHGFLPEPTEWPPCELAVIAGDICPIHDHSPRSQHHWLEREFKPWLEALPAEHVLGIAGNHDIVFASAAMPSFLHLPWHYLQDSGVEVCALRAWGTPWIPHIDYRWVFQAPKSDGGDFMAERFARIPAALDLLIAHAPPYGIADMTLGGKHVGSRALRDTIRNKYPRLVICGHLHEGRGVTAIGILKQRTIVANVCALDSGYQPVRGAPMRFLIPPAPAPVQIMNSR